MPHVGSTFTVSIGAPSVPLSERIPTRDTNPMHGLIRSFRFAPGTEVLVAEDNAVNARLLTKMLVKWGASVVHAKNGEEALRAASQTAFHLILMDCRMPGINGLEAAQRIRSGDGPCKNTPVIAVTANVFQDEREACLAAGMNDVVTKPIEMICLIECMSRCLLTRE